MITLKNNGKGPRAVLMNSGSYEFLQPGEQKTIDGSKVKAIPPDVAEVALEASDGGDLAPQPVNLDKQATGGALPQFDHDNNGHPGGSLPHDPPALSGMTRTELDDQAKLEGVDLTKITGTGKNGAVVMADIRDAIEAKRAGRAA
jgi:hypothetical protein